MGATAISAPHPDDAAALRAGASDPRAFAALYRRYVDDVYRYLVVKCGPQEAEDLVADTFVAALRSGGSYRGTGPAKAWLIGIARRKAVDLQRSRRATEPLDAAASVADPLRTEDVAVRRSELARIAAALARIGPERAEALRLRYFAGLDVAEIAALMWRSEAAVKMLLHRGLRQLRGELEEDEHG
jgi:RNA polymerase sigma-70 factor (ECF subfamily)